MAKDPSIGRGSLASGREGPNVTLDPVAGLAENRLRRGEAHAHVSRRVLAEGRGGKHGDALRFE